MRGFTLQSVGEPTNAKDVATKEYVYNSGGGAFEVKNGGYEAKGHLFIRGQKIGGIRDPVNDGEADNKRYVDNYVEEYVNGYAEKLKDGNGFLAAPWGINMMGKKLSGLSFPSKSDEAATREYSDKVGNDVREYTDRSNELLGERFKRLQFAFLKDNGKFVAYTPISMASQPLRDLTEPKQTSDAVTKKYVDDLIADNVGVGNMNGGGSPFFKENGNYQASHAINMGFKKLLNLPTPSDPYEAARKIYVDETVTNVATDVVDKTMKQRIHLIAATASYHGDLIKGDYQFTFGGRSVKTDKKHDMFNGFLMPYSGYIKSFVLKDFGLKFLPPPPEELTHGFIEDVIGINVPLPLFTLVLITDTNIIDLGTLNILFEKKGGDLKPYYSFTSSLPSELKDYKINAKIYFNYKE